MPSETVFTCFFMSYVLPCRVRDLSIAATSWTEFTVTDNSGASHFCGVKTDGQPLCIGVGSTPTGLDWRSISAGWGRLLASNLVLCMTQMDYRTRCFGTQTSVLYLMFSVLVSDV